MIDANDRLPTHKPEPLKPSDWILMGILILLLVFTFPFLWWIYRPLLWVIFRVALPLAAVAFIGYFALRAFRIGESSGPELHKNDFLQNLQAVWGESIAALRRSFKTVALSIIGGTLVFVVSVTVYTHFAKKSRTENQMNRTAQALVKYKNHYGSFPADLATLIGNDPLKREWFQDVWGNQMLYVSTKNGQGYTLTSLGADGKTGTSDDLTVSM